MSDEAVSVPPELAAEMTAYDPTSGELRTHYAGFFDPGFGYDPDGQFHGSRAALEVRAHDVPFNIEDGQRVCKLTFERMVERPTTFYGDSSVRSSYRVKMTRSVSTSSVRWTSNFDRSGASPPINFRSGTPAMPSMPTSSSGPPDPRRCATTADEGSLHHNTQDDIWYECARRQNRHPWLGDTSTGRR